jgi:hypothetical protein
VARAGLSFHSAQLVWLIFQASVLILALVLVGWHLGGKAGSRFVLMAPLLYVSLSSQLTLHIGNFQTAAIALAMIAAVAMARGRQALGAGILSFVVLAKLFPGVVLIALAARRQWRPLVLTLVGMAGWIGLALLVFGPAPFRAFLTFQVPRVATGEAFPQLAVPFARAINHAVQGLPARRGSSAGSAACPTCSCGRWSSRWRRTALPSCRRTTRRSGRCGCWRSPRRWFPCRPAG